jgi:hypothetical protein
MNGVQSPTGAEDFSSSLCVQTGSGAHPASYSMGTGGPFPGGKARPGLDADHSPPSSAEVKNEQELYLLSPHAPPWRVAGSLYLTRILISTVIFILIVIQTPIIIFISIGTVIPTITVIACCP